MSSVLGSVRSLMQMFDRKTKDFISEIDEVHMVWLEEIQHEANRMFSRDFHAEPELMPKTPSQKKNSRRKRVSLGRQEENQTRRRFSKGRRSNLRGSSVKTLNLISEEEPIAEASSAETSNTTKPKRTTRKNKQTKPEEAEAESQSPPSSCRRDEEVENKKPELVEEEEVGKNNKEKPDDGESAVQSPPKIPVPEVVVSISSEDRRSAEFARSPDASPGRAARKITIVETTESTRQSSVRYSLKLRHSLAGLRHSMTQESVRRTSRRSILKRKANRMGNSTNSSNCDGDDSSMDTAQEEDGEVIMEDEPADTQDDATPQKSKEAAELQTNEDVYASVQRVTRSVAANSPKLAPPALFSKPKASTPIKRTVAVEKLTTQAVRRSSRSTKRKSPDTVEDSPTKRFSPPKKSQSAVKPSMKSFLHTVHKNQMLMMTPNSLGRTAVIKSFIKHTTPMKLDPKAKELLKLEALKKKQEQEEERMRKMEEEKKKKQEDLKRRRDERIRRVFEAKVKEEQREEEKKKKIEQKMAQIDEKNDKAKKKVAMKRQEELELKKKLEEEAKKKKLQQEEEKRQQELLAKKKAEEEEQQARRALELKREQELLAKKREEEQQARRALELKRQQELRERELERQRQAAAERERMEREKALALQREVERAAREKEMRELEEKRKALEEKRKLEEQQRLAAKEKAIKEREEAQQREAAAQQAADAQTSAALNVTVDIERSLTSTPVGKGGGLNVTVDVTHSSPQSYVITPKGANKPLTVFKSTDDYGMDQNSDDSTDDESAPRKPIPSWAEGPNLKQIIMKQYFNPPDLDSFFGIIEAPKLENIFYKSKPRYFKRTSSAVWHSPPAGAK